MGFTREELLAFQGASVPDLIGPDCRMLIVGINPGLWTAATQTHFCHPSNRFYPALRKAGLVDLVVDASIGMTDEQRRELTDAGIGITNLVNRATARASELGHAELEEGGRRLGDLVARVAPRVVAVSGVTAFRTAFHRPKAILGVQPGGIGGSALWVVPNPSGLNAHVTADTLAGWLRLAADSAGLP
jgi:TDG/mug DNA glycosylase family protein